MLKVEGKSVPHAAEGTTALDLLRSSPHRLVVLLDESLAQWGGKRVLEVVRRDAVLSSRHAYVLLTARTRISQPVLESAQTPSRCW